MKYTRFDGVDLDSMDAFFQTIFWEIGRFLDALFLDVFFVDFLVHLLFGRLWGPEQVIAI